MFTKIVVTPATTAPSKPTDATIVVPIPLFSFDIDSLTRVIPAPNSPAKPKPDTNLKIAYQNVSVINPLAIFANEYIIILPKRTVSLPFLSPKIPQNNPPISMPNIW